MMKKKTRGTYKIITQKFMLRFKRKMRLQRLLHPLNLNVFKTAVDLTCIEIGLLSCIQ